LGTLSDRDKMYTFGASFPLPITGKTRGAYVRAKGEKIAARNQLAATEKEVEKSLVDSYTRYLNLKKAAGRFVPVIKHVNKNMSLLNNAYLEGRISIDGFFTKRDRFISAGMEYYDTLIELAESKAALERALGARLSEIPKKGEHP